MRRHCLASIVACLFSFPLWGITLDTLPDYKDKGMRLYIQGTQKLQDNDFIEAIDDLKQAVRSRSDFPEAFHNLGFAFEKTGNVRGAVECYERAVSLRPNYSSALNNLGFLLATTEADTTRAISLCNRAVEMEPRSACFRDSLGWAYYKAGRTDEAILHFKAAINLDPTFSKAHFNLGLCEFNRKNFSAASQEFENTIKLNSSFIKAYIPLATCFERMQQNNKAVFVYQQALTKCPDGSPVKKHIERQLKRLHSDSKSYYFSNMKQIQASSKLSDFLRRKNRTGSLLGSSSKSNDPLESSGSFTPVPNRVLRGTPTEMPWESQPNEIRSYSSLEKQAEPVRQFESTPPASNAELSISEERKLQRRYALSNSYLDRGLVNEAAQELERIVVAAGSAPIGRQAKNLLLKVRERLENKNNESAEKHLGMGKDFFRSGQYDLAENEIKKAIEMRPEYAEAYKDLALLHYNRGRLKDAYEESKRAIALDHGIKEAYIVLGSLYSKKGRIEEAIHVLQKVKELPGKEDAVTDLAERMINSLRADS